MNPTIEIPTERVMLTAIEGIAYYDMYLDLPNQQSLSAIRLAGLEQFLPNWYDFETHQCDPERFRQALQRSCYTNFLPPNTYIDYLKKEQQTGVQIHTEPFADLELFLREEVYKGRQLEDLSHWCQAWGINYLTLKNVLAVSPEGQVNVPIYISSNGRVCRYLGMNFFRMQDEAGLSRIKDPNLKIYQGILCQQVQQEYERFTANLLPILEQYDLRETPQVYVYINGVPQGIPIPGGVLI